MPKPRRVSITPSTHRLSVGPLKGPIGGFTQEQLASGVELVKAELAKAQRVGDEVLEKRLADDDRELRAELERRDLSAA